MADVFERILGQARVREFLRRVVAHNQYSHAYLFTGPVGSNKTLAASALAASILCHEGGCGVCDTCRRVMRHKHPDVHEIFPQGVQGYLVEQMREIIAAVDRSPIQADAHVFIINRADMLSSQSANALLKTLEEPPEHVHFILLARTHDSVLPTIVSRCQVVPFRHIPPAEASGIVAQQSGATREMSAMAIDACDGSITKAISFVQSSERMEFRRMVLAELQSIKDADDLDILTMSRTLLERAQAPLDEMRHQLDEERAQSADFMAASALKLIDERNKRTLSAKTLENIKVLLALIRSWLRDVMMCKAGMDALIIHTDMREDITRVAREVSEAACVRALTELDATKEALGHNVSPNLCLDVLLIHIREELYGANRAR